MDPTRIREESREATTENLLDRVTVYREEMEPAAIEVIEEELSDRGVIPSDLVVHEAMRERDGLTRRPDGTIIRCDFCPRPAIERRRKWHRLWGWFIPLFPRWFSFCKIHANAPPTDATGRTMHYDPMKRKPPE